MKNLRNKQKGASLIEIISYLGVAAIVIIGAVMLLTSAFSGANANRALNEVTALQMNVKKLYMGQQAGFGTGNINTVLANATKFPSTLQVNTTATPATVTNAWNAAVVVTGVSNTFTISYAGVPQSVCIDLLSAQGSSGWVSVNVNAAGAVAPPISPAAAAGACTGATNTIVWTSA